MTSTLIFKFNISLKTLNQIIIIIIKGEQKRRKKGTVNKLFNSLEGHKTKRKKFSYNHSIDFLLFANLIASSTSRRNRIKTDLLLQISLDLCWGTFVCVFAQVEREG